VAGIKDALIESFINRFGESAALDEPPATITHKIKKIALTKSQGSSNSVLNRGSWKKFSKPDIDFQTIEKAVYTDSYLNKAVNKYVDLMWKNGYNIKTTDPDIFKYIRQRMVLHTYATGEPFDQFLERLSRELITYHNVLVYIKRFDPTQIGPLGKSIAGKIKPLGKEQHPAIGYELIPVTSISVDFDDKNNVREWKQEAPPGGKDKTYNKNEIIHIKKGAWAGKLFGDPFLRPTLDDTKAYRQLEEDAVIIAHQMIEPKIVYSVGDPSLPQTIMDLDDDDIEETANALQYALENGAIVIPGSHKVDVLETRNAQNISEYMDRLKFRVFGGLGLSPVHFGEAGAANRSVTDRLDVQLYDGVKSYQRTVEQYVTFFIFAEWLMEAGYDTDFSVEDDEDWAILEFEEIDTDSLIKKQNHSTSLWVQDGITHDEYRKTLGKLPVTTEQESRLYSDMIGKVNAKYQQEVDKSKSQETSGGENQKTNAKTRATKTSMVETTNTSEDEWNELKLEVLLQLENSFDSLNNWLDDIAYVYAFYFGNIERSEIANVTEQFWNGHSDGSNQALMAGYQLKKDPTKDTAFLSSTNKRVSKYLDKLRRDLRNRVEKVCLQGDTKEVTLLTVSESFDALHARLNSISETESNAAYNYGVLCVAYTNEIKKVWREGSEDCDKCTSGYEEVTYAGIDDIPPISSHPNCKCRIKIV
jgi:hypothetical protein